MKVLIKSKFIISLCTLSMLFHISVSAQDKQPYKLTSPNGNIKVIIEDHYKKGNDSVASAHFSIYYKSQGKYTPVISDNELGISTDKEQFKNINLKGAGVIKAISANYKMITGKRRLCSNAANESTLSFVNANGKQLNIVFRVYNDGIAFRYQMPKWSEQPINVRDEYTAYHIPEKTDRWMQTYDPGYEGFYPYSTTGKGDKSQQWAYPALFKVVNQPVWYLISEANNSEFNCAARLTNNNDFNTYKVTYPEPRKNFQQQGDLSSLPWSSQWHTLIVGSLATIVQSTLITDVSEPNKLSNTDWIEPGAVSWIYWANNHGSKDYKKVIEYVDLAKNMGWPYVLIDWEWDVMSNGGNVEDAVKYAKSKGIKPMLWYNSGTTDWSDATPFDRLRTEEKRIKEFQWLNKIGVYGIKVDFFAGDQQDMMKLYLDILKDAAQYHLMVDFHGATIPRGWARTYPNLMTVEAVYGAEWYNNNSVMTNKAAVHNTTLPFTRNVVGSMDYTPVTFSNSQHPHITSYGHELALSVVFESGLQNFADRPEAFYNLPDAPRNFLKTVPVAWDETRLLSGYPGDHVVIARRQGSKWYIGGLNGQNNAKTLQFKLDFVKQKHAKMSVIKDGDNDKSFKTAAVQVFKDQDIKVDCLPRGGFVAVIE
ncbi:glycoside hydrolase family 97 protein [Mucilaginibacter sp. KACC 22063]|uniref:glycoside hydrolase family 97 protein n=1 Tax=Mucilaginibacter sp. KACC 22063 TaxID=3025666 RepID=UPI00236518D8|nr:glycoside hydrolase family 97 protein [Mucilaginibacter sp. KACC 22063]WDF57294.1 glycoside hydrolase family 97 catalytic domain-containing protein [Mucilaginibacter sp. KACC 22063]